MHIDLCFKIQCPRGATPGQVFAQTPASGQRVPACFDAITKGTAAFSRVAEHIGVQHPQRVQLGCKFKVLVVGKNLFSVGGNRPG